MKVSELDGAELDYWVARAEGLPLSSEWNARVGPGILVGVGAGDLNAFSPSTDWRDGGPIIEKAEIGVQYWYEDEDDPDDYIQTWLASIRNADLSEGPQFAGQSPLVAAMRAYVASKFGTHVDDLKFG